MKKFVALIAAIMMVVMGTSFVTATTPEFNENQDADATVWNTPPYIVDGWIEILDQEANLVWSQLDPAEGPRGDSYIWESEKLVVYVIIHDDNGESDLWQHTAQAWLSPEDALITDLAIVEFTNTEGTEALFKGEKFMPSPAIWQCMHDVYITDVDKYGYTATNSGLEIFWTLYINPMMTSTFIPESILWDQLFAGAVRVPACTNPHIEHVYAACIDPDTGQEIHVNVNYLLKIHGTDMEGGIGVSHVIPCENIEYQAWKADGTWIVEDLTPLTNGEVELGEFIACEDIFFNFFLTVPYVEPGDYHGEVGFCIEAL